MLLTALQTLSDPNTPRRQRQIAGQAILEAVPPLVRGYLMRHYNEPQPVWLEDAEAHAVEKCVMAAASFQGAHEGEAVRWVQRIAKNRYISLWRSHGGEDLSSEMQTVGDESRSANGLGARQDIESLQRLLDMARLAAGKKRRRMEVFIAYRFGEPQAVEGDTDDERRRARARLYQDRKVGAETLRGLAEQLDIEEDERDMLLAFASTRGVRTRAALASVEREE